MSHSGRWAKSLQSIRTTPPHLRYEHERAALAGAEEIRLVAAALTNPSCTCCPETVRQLAEAAARLEEIVGLR